MNNFLMVVAGFPAFGMQVTLVILVVGMLLGGCIVRFGVFHDSSANPETQSRRLSLAWRLASANLWLIGLSTAFGIGATALGLSTAEHTAQRATEAAILAAIVAAVVILPFIVGTFACGVFLASRGGASRSVGQGAGKLLAWAWYSLPLALGLWMASAIAFVYLVVGPANL